MRLVAKPVRIGFLALLLAVAAAAPHMADDSIGPHAAEHQPVTGFASLTGIEIDTNLDRGDRIELRLTGDPRVIVHEVEDPYRVVIDLEGTINRLTQNVHPMTSDFVKRVRAGQYSAIPDPVSRIVLDMKGRYPVTTESQGNRLVITVAAGASAAPDPAEATVAAAKPAPYREESPASAARHVEDEAVREALEGIAASIPADEAAARTAARATPIDEPVLAPIAPRSGSIEPSVIAPRPVLARETEPAARQNDRPDLNDTLAPVVFKPADTQLAAPDHADTRFSARMFEREVISGEEQRYTGKAISLNLVDADIKQVFRLFHEISGINFVLDPGVSGRVTIVVDEVPWDQALDLILKNNGLDKVFEGNVIRIASTQKLAQEAGARKALKEAKELEAEPVTITRTLSYAKAQEVDQIIKTGVLLSPRGRSFYDERTNTIIITDIPAKIDPLDRLLTSLDAKTPQVMIEARIVETSREYTKDLGIRWGFGGERSPAIGQPFDWEFPHRASVDWDLDLARNPGVSQLAFSFGNIKDSFTLDIALDALETEGKGRILSAPKIQTANNEQAEIEQGVRIPIVNTTATEINVEFVSASLLLRVTPQITAEGTVSMDLEVENNSPDFVNRTGDQPSIRTQRATTKVLVDDGGTSVIGGIFTINEGQSEVGVPFFRKIPFFGWLFKSRNVSRQNRELLVFVTPKIVN